MFIVNPIVLDYPQMLRKTQKPPFSSVLCQVGFFQQHLKSLWVAPAGKIQGDLSAQLDQTSMSCLLSGTSSPWQWRQWKFPVDELSKDYRQWALKLSDDISLIG